MPIFSSVLEFFEKKGGSTPNWRVLKPKKAQKSSISRDNFQNFGVLGKCLKNQGEYTFGFFLASILLVENGIKTGCYENV